MVDVIPGTKYYDTVMDRELICNGVSPQDEDLDVVVLEYEGISETIEVPFHLMLESETFEVLETPH